MKKLFIFSLLALSNFVGSSYAMNEPNPEQIIREMRERVRDLSAVFNRAIEIRNQQEKLAVLHAAYNQAIATETFLRDNQMHGVGNLRRVAQLKQSISESIQDINDPSAMDVDIA